MYDNLADYSKAFTVEAVYGDLRNPENINFKSVAKVDDKKYGKLQVAVNAAEGKTVEVINDVTLKESVVVAKNTTIDFGNKAITANVYPAFRIQGNANVTVKNGNITNNDYVFVLGASDGSSAGDLTIESGKYVGEVTVASVTKGLLTISGGEFNLQNVGQYGYTYLINCIDNNYPASANVVVTGGKFYGFNPENNAAEGANTNFCAEGYVASEYTEGGSTYYIVEEGGWVAQNTTTGVKYKTLQAAIDACAAGNNTIVLLANISDDVTVNETAGVVATYQDKLVGLYFFATSGGATEDVENVWGGSYGYLRSVDDPYENPEKASRYHWNITLSKDDILNHGLPLDDILVNSAYYPSSGFDGGVIKHCNTNLQDEGIVSFIYCDYASAEDDVVRKATTEFKGYHLFAHRTVQKEEVRANKPISLNFKMTPSEERKYMRLLADKPSDLYCHWIVMERDEGYGEKLCR
jgi:hypothetical protein